MKKRTDSSRPEKVYTNKQIRSKTILSFAVFTGLFALGIFGWFKLKNQPLDQGLQGGIQKPLRRVLDGNERVFSKAFDPEEMAKTYPKSAAAAKPRVNGGVGLKSALDTNAWRMRVIRSNGDTLLLTLADLQSLPKTEIIFDFKCIEGWSQVTHWGGVKFSDFLKKYKLDAEASLAYVGLSTPDEAYYVGIDMPSAMHAQTLLCYEMNGKPLPLDQGYPVRLIIPVKYGIKSLKRIGSIYFSDERPRDYWYEKGYDYYSGL